MKRAFIICLLVFHALAGYSQSALFNRNVDWLDASSGIKAIACDNNQWIIGGWQKRCVYGLLLRVDSVGNILDSLPPYSQIAYVSDLDTEGGSVYFVGAQPPILVKKKTNSSYYDFMRIAVGKYDLQTGQFEIVDEIDTINTLEVDSAYGNHPAVYFPSIEGFPYQNLNYYYQCAAVAPNKLFISKGNYLALVDPTHHYAVSWLKHFAGYINDMVYSSGLLYLATDSGLVQTDINGNLLRSLSTQGNVVAGYKTPSGKTYFTDAQKVFETDSLLNVVASYTLSDTLANWIGLTGNGRSICMAGQKKSDSTKVLAVLDSDLVNLSLLPLRNQCHLPNWIASNDSIIMVGTDTMSFGSVAKSIISYTAYSYVGASAATNADALVLSAVMDSSTLQYRVAFDNLYLNGRLLLASFDVSAKLVNSGQDTIHSIAIQSENFFTTIAHGPDGEYAGVGCSENIGFVITDHLNVAPGDTFFIPNMFIEMRAGTSIRIPVYITSINGQVVHSGCNGVAYLSDSITVVTGVQEVESAISIYPNPTGGTITINGVSAGSIFSLADISGRLLMEKKLIQPTEQVILSGLPSGIYLYAIKGEGHLPFTGKIIKL